MKLIIKTSEGNYSKTIPVTKQYEEPASIGDAWIFMLPFKVDGECYVTRGCVVTSVDPLISETKSATLMNDKLRDFFKDGWSIEEGILAQR